MMLVWVAFTAPCLFRGQNLTLVPAWQGTPIGVHPHGQASGDAQRGIFGRQMS